MKLLFRKFIGRIFFWLFYASRKENGLFGVIFNAYLKIKKRTNFCLITMRPKVTNDIPVIELKLSKMKKVAIIMQGPLMAEDDFTLETARFYKRIFPECLLIVSTWKNESENLVLKLREMHVKVLLNDPPKNTGIGNVNYQVLSALSGIKYAKKFNMEYVMKTRTDQRIYRKDVCSFFCGLLDKFPCGSSYETLKVHKRIIVLQSAGTSVGTMFVPFYLSDFLFFGDIRDMEDFFQVKESEININSSLDVYKYRDDLINRNLNVARYLSKIAPEIILFTDYLRRNGVKENLESVETYWKYVRDYIIAISWHEIDIYWNKYFENFLESERTGMYYQNDNLCSLESYNWTFLNWFNLYSGMIKYTDAYERIAKMSIQDFLKNGNDI